VEYLEPRLAAKRRKLDDLLTELRWLQYDPTLEEVRAEAAFQKGADHSSTPISRKSGGALLKGVQSPLPVFDQSSLDGKTC